MEIDPERANGLEPPSQDKQDELTLSTLQRQVAGVKDIMIRNVNNLMARSEGLEDLTDKSKHLQNAAEDFKQTSQKVACTYCLKNVKLVVVIVVVVLILILIIILLATGVIPVSSPPPPLPPLPTTKP